jgi:hypothetical protein
MFINQRAHIITRCRRVRFGSMVGACVRLRPMSVGNRVLVRGSRQKRWVGTGMQL